MDTYGTVHIVWQYDVCEDDWILDSEDSVEYKVLDYDVQGTWKQYDDKDCIFIRNQDESGMEVYVEGIHDLPEEWIRMNLVTENLNNSLAAVYEGNASNGEKLTVSFYTPPMSYQEFMIHAEIPGWFNSRTAYLEDFTPNY
ncbi:hypothetical protein [Blautia obeum]|uniref:hypothetical protein n=1 Tax=Blautia obeum TaxID=40520 RepID=UPI003CFE5231